eukprot:m.28297 g.28297  ORF g.28297 m.28297 type:complete len:302 (+) comp9458_c0_seq1:159-1064(+)
MLVGRRLSDKVFLFFETMKELYAGIFLYILYNILLTILLHRRIIPTKPEGDFLSTIGVTLTFFIQFANNQAYSRWWEARQLWGGIVNISRTLPTYLEGSSSPGKTISEKQKKDIVRRHIAYIRLVNHQLRRDPLPATAEEYLQPEELELLSLPNPAVGLLQVQSRAVNELHHLGLIDSYARVNLLGIFGRCLDLQGACERIKTTQFPPTYKLFLRLILVCFLGIMPLDMYDFYGVFSPLPTTIIGVAYLGLERFGSDLEDPFEGLENDCAMLTICDTIQKDLLGPDSRKYKHKRSSNVCLM